MKPKINLETAQELFRYDPETGIIFWRVTLSNRSPKGTIAGCVNGNGYRVIFTHGRSYRAHHIAWLLQHWRWPLGEIDHINRIKDDNRAINLRDVSTRENSHNKQTVRCDNTTGFTGVSFNKRTGKYVASIYHKGKRINLGYYNTPEEASRVYVTAKLELHSGYIPYEV